MKKYRRIVLLFLAVILIISSFAGCNNEKEQEVSYEINMQDGNFASEESFLEVWSSDNWAPAGTEHTWCKETHTDDGTGSLKVFQTQSASSWGQKINLVKNAKYRVSAWIKSDAITSTTHNGNGGAYVVVTGTDICVGHCSSFGQPYSEDWTYYEADFTAGDTGEFSLLCRVWGATGTAYFDEIKVELLVKEDPDVMLHWAQETDIEFPDTSKGFSLLAIGDPQIVVSGKREKYLEGMTNFLSLTDKFNTLYAMDMGDLVDTCDYQSWSTSVEGHELFDEAGLKYSLSMGNHDYGSLAKGSTLIGLASGAVVEKDTSGFERKYPLDKYTEMYGTENFGSFSGSMTNTWHRFTFKGETYIIIALEYAPEMSVINAAKELADNNPAAHIIVTTHCFMSPTTLEIQNEQSSHLKNVVTGDVMWSKFISKCPNVFLVCSGHDDCYGSAAKVSYNDAGKPVTFIQIDPQGTLNGSEMMGAYIFIENGTDISVYTYCPTTGRFYNGGCYTMSVSKGTEGKKGGCYKISEGTSCKIFSDRQLDGTDVIVTRTYTSSNEKVVTVAEDGTITAVGSGTATVSCMIDRHISPYCIEASGKQRGAKTLLTVSVTVE